MTRGCPLTVGYRFQSGSITARDNEIALGTQYEDSTRFTDSAGRVGILYRHGDSGRVYLRYDRIFRYPFTDEIAYYQGFLGGPFPGTVFFNKDLRPERGYSIEVGAEVRPLGSLELGLTLFSTNLTDEIAYNPASGLNENLWKTRRNGAEVSLRYRPDGPASFFCAYTWIDPEFRAGPHKGNTIPLVPSHKATAGVAYAPTTTVSVEASVTATSSVYLGSDFDNDQPRLAGSAVVDLFCHLRPELTGGRTAHLFAGVRNIFDAQYATLGFDWGFMNVYYPAQGRTYVAGASLEL